LKRVRVKVHGRVQGVFFRSDTQARARSLGLAGSVRNSPDGTVEAVFEGRPEAVDSMVEWCKRGPSGARVDHVDVWPEGPQGESGFVIR
jgi:acylphosphatase